MKITVVFIFKDIENVPEYNFDLPVCMLTFVSFVVIYELIMYCYSRKISKLSIKDIMLI